MDLHEATQADRSRAACSRFSTPERLAWAAYGLQRCRFRIVLPLIAMPATLPISLVPISTVLVLPDLHGLAARLRAALADLSAPAAEAMHREAERTGRVPVFQGEPQRALELARALRAAGLTVSVNRIG